MGAFCAFITGLMIDQTGWRSAFWLPGAFSVGLGVLYFFHQRDKIRVKFCQLGRHKDSSEKKDISAEALVLRQLIIPIS